MVPSLESALNRPLVQLPRLGGVRDDPKADGRNERPENERLARENPLDHVPRH
jgi:hypothetical protein